MNLSTSQLTDWYLRRAIEIESFSRIVDFSLELVRLGLERGVQVNTDFSPFFVVPGLCCSVVCALSKTLQGLELLYDDLETMETLVYECNIDDSLTLEHLREMPHSEKVALMMNKVNQPQKLLYL